MSRGGPGTRSALGALAAIALALVAAPAAQADRLLLDQADAQDLAEQLAEARQATGVCFAWEVRVDAFDGSPGGIDGGSDQGPDAPGGAGCERALVLQAVVTYTSEASEAEDSADVGVAATGFRGARTDDLLDLAGVEEADLLGDRDDRALFNLVAALPLLAGQLDPAVGARLPALETGGAPADAAVGERPGSDWWRTNGPVMIFGLLLAAVAAWLLVTGLRSRREARPTPPKPRST